MDKRIHFALNCGAKSCPPIRVFTGEGLEDGLKIAAQSFCQGNTLCRGADLEALLQASGRHLKPLSLVHKNVEAMMTLTAGEVEVNPQDKSVTVSSGMTLQEEGSERILR